MAIELKCGDCLELMGDIPDKSIDAIITDLPYGQTHNNWDTMLPLDLMWGQFNRVIKDKGAIILFGQGVFAAQLVMSNSKYFRYDIVWEKSQPTGFLNAKKRPLRSHEMILVFYKKLPVYNPQKTTGHERKISAAKSKINSKMTPNYNPYGLTSYDSTERYPRSVWRFPKDTQKSAITTTQKPVKLMEELVKTYTNEGDTVLDCCMGSGTTGVACKNLNRSFIGMEIDRRIFDKAYARIFGQDRAAPCPDEEVLCNG